MCLERVAQFGKQHRMDFFKRNIALAQQQASEAAAKAKALAQEVSDKGQVLAQQAGSNAKALAQQVNGSAHELAQQVTIKTKQMAEQAKTTAKNFSAEDAKEALHKLGTSLGQKTVRHGEPSTKELEAYGIDDDFLVFLRGLTYSTFRDFSGLPEADDVGFVDNGHGVMRLNPWQEQHANLVLRTVKELQDLRYVLCPRRMEEERFWKIYFALAYRNLPEGCITGKLPGGRIVKSSDENSDIPPLTGKYTFVQTHKNSSEAKPEQKEDDKDDHEYPMSRSEEDLDKDDDLDVYLENVLNEGQRDSGSELDDFEDIEEYMDQLQEASSGDDPVEVGPADLDSGSGENPKGDKKK